MSKKPKKVEGHPASNIFLGLIGAFNDYSGISRIIERIRLERQAEKMMMENERYLQQFDDYAEWLQEFKALMKRRPKVGKPLSGKLP